MENACFFEKCDNYALFGDVKPIILLLSQARLSKD